VSLLSYNKQIGGDKMILKNKEKIGQLGEQLKGLYQSDLGLYTALFVDERPVEKSKIPSGLYESMHTLGIATGANEVRSTVRILNLDGAFFATDHVSYQGDEQSEGMVMPFHPENTYLSNEMRIEGGESVLEIGVGSGVNSILAVLRGAEKVTALDVNPRTFDYTRFNMALNRIEESKIELILNESTSLDDLLKPVSGKRFDYVITNPPFEYGRDNDTQLRNSSSGNDGLDMIRAIVSQVDDYLSPTGRMQMVYFAPGTEEGPTELVEVAKSLREGSVEVKYRENSMKTKDFVDENVGSAIEIPPEHEFYWTGMLHYAKENSGLNVISDGIEQDWHLPISSTVPMMEKHDKIDVVYRGESK
jgi:tRNA1(Val) A37 N6-methylase TrmN6